MEDMSKQIVHFVQDIDCWVHKGTDDKDFVELVVLEIDRCKVYILTYDRQLLIEVGLN